MIQQSRQSQLTEDVSELAAFIEEEMARVNPRADQIEGWRERFETTLPQLPHGTLSKVFSERGDFEAMRAAEAYLRALGYSVGRMERGAPRGILRGEHDVQKWRNLSADHRSALDGQMEGVMRTGPVIVTIWSAGHHAQD